MNCNRCPEKDPRCLDFHHIDHATKSFCVSAAPNCGYSRERILEEIAKCEVICANCHRKETFDGVTYKAKIKRPTRDKVSKFDIRYSGKLKKVKS